MTLADPDLMRSVMKFGEAERRSKRERVREHIRICGVPVPPDVVQEIALLNPKDAHDVLCDHPGFAISEALVSYETSLRVFERSVEDLLRSIQNFERASRDGTIVNNIRQA